MQAMHKGSETLEGAVDAKEGVGFRFKIHSFQIYFKLLMEGIVAEHLVLPLVHLA